MTVATEDFAAWIKAADIPQSRLSPERDALLAAVYRFRQQQGSDYYSTRLLGHFLLHCDCGLKIAQIARLLGISRPCASRQQSLSSKQVIQQAHHRMDGRPHGKLLPRYAGPIAAFLLAHPDASRGKLLDFIERTFSVRVSRIALYKFLKKYGLQDVAKPQPARKANPAEAVEPPGLPQAVVAVPTAASGQSQSQPQAAEPGTVLLPVPPPFSMDGRNTPAPSF